MMRTRKIILGLLATALPAMIMAAGCQNAGQGRTGDVPFIPGERQGDVSMYRDMQFDDIPVPAEYRLLRVNSYSFQGSRFRSGLFYYEGPLYYTDATRFFLAQAPTTGWTLEKQEQGSNYRRLRFRKGPEQLLVTVRPLRNGSEAEVQIDNIAQNDLLLKGEMPMPKD